MKYICIYIDRVHQHILSGLKDRVPVGQDNFEHMTVLYYLTTVGQNYSFLREVTTN